MQTMISKPETALGTGDFRSIGLVAQMLDDPGVALVSRALDADWFYCHALESPVSGFNPYRREIYYASRSAISAWLADDDADVRGLNENDSLVREVLFAAHDYLHAWCASTVDRLRPELALGYGPITRENAEQHVFCHLFTEAVATVGLDYWYLACTDLADVLDIGTTYRTLTVSYDQRREPEYRRFSPGLEVQDPSFLWILTRFYANGRFPGFRADALRRSPAVLRWLRHELSYGALQRRYTRQWLNHLAPRPVYEAGEALEREIDLDKDWCRSLVDAVADLLWAKVKENQPGEPVLAPASAPWTAPQSGPIDFRFTNANAFGEGLWEEIAARGLVEGCFDALFTQLLSARIHAEVPAELLKSLATVRTSRSPALLRQVVAHLPRVEPAGDEPRDIFVLP